MGILGLCCTATFEQLPYFVLLCTWLGTVMVKGRSEDFFGVGRCKSWRDLELCIIYMYHYRWLVLGWVCNENVFSYFVAHVCATSLH